MATREQAYEQYKAAYGSNFDADADADFQNYWNNSADSGAYQGAGYNQSWDAILGDVKNRVNERFNTSTNNRMYDSQSAQGNALYGSGSGNGSNTPTGGVSSGGGVQTVTQSWTQSPETQARNTELWQMLMDRARTSLDIDPNSSPIRPQVDAYRAEQERARRNALSDASERLGPYANLRGEERMGAERVGQNVAGFQAELMGRELTARRNEIADSLKSLAGLLSADQELALRRELGLLDNEISKQQLSVTSRGQDLNYDQFLRELALRDWVAGNEDYYRRSGI